MMCKVTLRVLNMLVCAQKQSESKECGIPNKVTITRHSDCGMSSGCSEKCFTHGAAGPAVQFQNKRERERERELEDDWNDIKKKRA